MRKYQHIGLWLFVAIPLPGTGAWTGSLAAAFLDMRLKKALSLLENGEHTVTEVAESIGFRDYNHFGRLFRKRYGCTPYDVKSGKVSADEAAKNSGIL